MDHAANRFSNTTQKKSAKKMAGNLVWCGQLRVFFQLTLGLYTDFLGKNL